MTGSTSIPLQRQQVDGVITESVLADSRPFIIVCGTEGCANHEDAINRLLVPLDYMDLFCESFGHGTEDAADYCPGCGQLGVLCEDVVPTCACIACAEAVEGMSRLPVRYPRPQRPRSR